MPFHHIGIFVSNLEESRKFYLAALAPLGYKELQYVEGAAVGFGIGQVDDFWLTTSKPRSGDAPTTGVFHVAFKAESREIVDKFHEAALKAGGKDNGAPGLRPEYGPNYYGAFILDADGHNIEAVIS